MSENEALNTENQPTVEDNEVEKKQENSRDDEIITLLKGMAEGMQALSARGDSQDKKDELESKPESRLDSAEFAALKAQSDATAAALKEIQEKADNTHVNKIEEFDVTYGGAADGMTLEEKNAYKIDYVFRQLNGGQ